MKTIRSMAAASVAILSLCGFSEANAAATMLYTANPTSPIQGFGRVAIYDPAASGTIAPLSTLDQLEGTFSLAFDPQLRLYTKSWVGRSDIMAYDPNSVGASAPIFSSYGTSNTNTHVPGLAVDSKGYILALTLIADASSNVQPYLDVYSPYSPMPSGSIPLNANGVSGLTVDGDDNIIVGVLGRKGPNGQLLPDYSSIEIFPPHLSSTTPIRTIAGSNTGLDGTGGYSLAYSKLSGRIYAGSFTGQPKVLVFDSHANGNVAPLRTITGAATGLRPYIGSLAGNPATGEIFVLSADAQSAAVITVYPQLANGNAAPSRTINDSTASFTGNTTIAFTPPPTVAINAGGGASSNFSADTYFIGGASVTWTNPVDTSWLVGVPPPQNVLQSDREGNFNYKITGFVPNSQHTVTAYFVENYFTDKNKRVFNFYVNGVLYLQDFDVFMQADFKRFKAIQRTFIVYASGNGEISVQGIATKDQAKVGAIVVN